MFTTLHQVHRHLTTSSFCGQGVGLKTEAAETKTTSPAVSQAPRRDYQGLYMKGEENTWICTKCGHNFRSDHGLHSHLKVTTCGFGTREPKPQQKTSFKSLYRKEGEVHICNPCGAEYKSDGGVHHHLRKTQCGFGSEEPKKNLKTLPYTSKVGSAHICNFCHVEFISEEGVKNHHKMTNCIQLHTASPKEKGQNEKSSIKLNTAGTMEEEGRNMKSQVVTFMPFKTE